MKSTIIFVLLLIGTAICQECKSEREEYKECGTACPTTCSNFFKTGRMCIAMCKSGCFCKDPYIRDDQTGQCVLIPECSVKPVCDDPNEAYNECGTACPRTCANIKNTKPIICPRICKMGCFCKDPFVRDEKSGKCVAIEGCPSV